MECCREALSVGGHDGRKRTSQNGGRRGRPQTSAKEAEFASSLLVTKENSSLLSCICLQPTYPGRHHFHSQPTGPCSMACHPVTLTKKWHRGHGATLNSECVRTITGRSALLRPST